MFSTKITASQLIVLRQVDLIIATANEFAGSNCILTAATLQREPMIRKSEIGDYLEMNVKGTAVESGRVIALKATVRLKLGRDLLWQPEHSRLDLPESWYEFDYVEENKPRLLFRCQ